MHIPTESNGDYITISFLSKFRLIFGEIQSIKLSLSVLLVIFLYMILYGEKIYLASNNLEFIIGRNKTKKITKNKTCKERPQSSAIP